MLGKGNFSPRHFLTRKVLCLSRGCRKAGSVCRAVATLSNTTRTSKCLGPGTTAGNFGCTLKEKLCSAACEWQGRRLLLRPACWCPGAARLSAAAAPAGAEWERALAKPASVQHPRCGSGGLMSAARPVDQWTRRGVWGLRSMSTNVHPTGRALQPVL